MTELGEVGRLLREARENRGISLEQAEEATKIRKKYLNAVEQGHRDSLPDEVYIKGFIRTYGNYLGLDGQKLVAVYKRNGQPDTPKPEARSDAPPGRGAATRPAPPGKVGAVRTPVPRGEGKSRPASVRVASAPAAFPWRTLVLALLVLAAGVALAWVLYGSREVPQPAAATPPPAPAPAPPAPAPAEQPPPAPAPRPSDSPASTVTRGQPGVDAGGPHVPITVAPGPIQLQLKFRGNAWVKVVADGKPVVEGILRTGSTHAYSATERMEITVGWVEVVDFTVNGQEFGALATETHRRIVINARKP